MNPVRNGDPQNKLTIRRLMEIINHLAAPHKTKDIQGPAEAAFKSVGCSHCLHLES